MGNKENNKEKKRQKKEAEGKTEAPETETKVKIETETEIPQETPVIPQETPEEAPEEAPEAETLGQIELSLSQITKFAHERVIKDDDIKGFNTKVNELARSIQSEGQIQPVIVRPIAEEQYELVDGYRRFKAIELLGNATITAIIRNYDEKTANIVCLSSNLEREDLNDMDKAILFGKLKDQGLTQDAISKKYGLTRQTVTQIMGLLKTSKEVQEALRKGEISRQQALEVKNLPENQQKAVLENTKTAKEVKAEVQALQKEEKAEKSKDEKRTELEAEQKSIKTRLSQLEANKTKRTELTMKAKSIALEIKELQKSQKGQTKEEQDLEKKAKEIAKAKDKRAKLEAEQSEYKATKQKFGHLNPADKDHKNTAFDKSIDALKTRSEREGARLKQLEKEFAEQKKLVTDLVTELNGNIQAKQEMNRNYNSSELLATQINKIEYELGGLQKEIEDFEVYQKAQLIQLEKVKETLAPETAKLMEKQQELATISAELKAIGDSAKLTSDLSKQTKMLSRITTEILALS